MGLKLNGFFILAGLLIIAGCEHSQETPDTSTATDSASVTSEVPAPHPGEAVYQANCAACHDQAVYKAPSRTFLAMLGARNVLSAMDEGLMQAQASMLSVDQRKDVAEYLTGQDPDALTVPAEPPQCGPDHQFDPSQVPASLGWGVDHANTRFQPAAGGGLDRSNIESLEVKWAFAYPNAIQARSQPGFGGGAVYFGSHDGTVRALDAKTGCLRWSFKANGEVRNAVVVSPWSAATPDPDPVIYFADIIARVYAVKARTGELLWSEKVDEHPDATVTGTVALHDGRVYVPVSSLEVVSAVNPAYACCTFRGSVVALDATTGTRIWKSYTIDQAPSKAGENREGTDILAASGAPVWNSPAIDEKRGLLYVGTGENYSSPADGNSDAIIAFRLSDGQKAWVSQQTAGDAWNVACLSIYTSNDANCPEENGPDYDFGSSPMLITLESGRQLVVGGQKSGRVVALEPDSGEVVWKTQVGRGGVQGGIHFGMAAEGERLYIPINDMAYAEDSLRYGDARPARPGLYALDATSGKIAWSAPANDTCGEQEGCDPGISHAIASVPGAVIAGYLDGHLRVHDGDSGEVIWDLNTLQDFDTVSGKTANGGSFSGGGALIADGMIYLNSGYGIYGHMPGNVLLAIGPAGE